MDHCAVPECDLGLRQRVPHSLEPEVSVETDDGFSHSNADWRDTAFNDEVEVQEDTIQVKEISQSLLAQLRSTDRDAQFSAVSKFRALAFADKESSRAAQLSLQNSSHKEAAELAFGLRGQVRAATRSRHANYVVQKIIQVMPAGATSFVIDELLGAGSE